MKSVNDVDPPSEGSSRELKVGQRYRYNKFVPEIILRGNWLEKIGFKEGDRVNVKCEKHRIIITIIVSDGD